MVSNYVKIAIRNLLKRRFFSLLNILGLAISITFTLLIGSYIWGELQVNDGLKNADNQYIIRSRWKKPGLGYEDVTVAPLGKTLRNKYPGLVANYYSFDAVTTAVSVGNRHFVREPAEAGDSTMLTMFGFAMLQGNARTALSEPNSVVLTEINALKYFGKTDVLGKVLRLSNYTGGQQAFTVTGVLKSLPKNSVTYLWDIPVNLFISLNSLAGRTFTDGWKIYNIANYVELQEGITPDQLVGPMKQVLATYAPNEVQQNLLPFITPLKSYYREFNKSIVKKTIYTLSAIAGFILLMAIVNFVNIDIANSSSRIKEIGIRKALGSLKRQLVYQFLAESILLAVLAMGLSLVFYELFRSSFGDIVGRKLDTLWTVSPFFLGAIILFTIFIGAIAGSYPAFTLSSLPAVDSLKGKLTSIREGVRFRRFLITIQFAVALLIFCGAVVISQQVRFLFTSDTGYNKEHILLVELPHDWTPEGVANIETVRNELARIASVDNITISSASLKGGPGYDINLYPVGSDSTASTSTYVVQTDEHFLKTYQIPLVAGTFYRSSKPADQEDKIVLNETASRTLGYRTPDAAVGQRIYSQGYSKPITVIGVTKDFSFRSMKEKIGPVAISHVNGAGHLFAYFSIKLASNNLPETVTAIEQKFHQLLPDVPFDFSFTDAALQQLYQAELQLQTAAQTATVVAVLIVIFGLLSMVSLSIARRTKEVAIRKVLGARVQGIVLLFMQEFLIALLIATLLAFPVAFLLMQKWLQNFAYHIDVNWLSFVGVGLAFIVVIGVVVSLQTIKAARMNPVKSLRSE